MDRRKFMNRAAAVAAASFTTDMTLSQRAEAFEGVMIEGLPYHVGKPVICEPDRERSMAPPGSRIGGGGAPSGKLVAGMDDPRLPPMPKKANAVRFLPL